MRTHLLLLLAAGALADVATAAPLLAQESARPAVDMAVDSTVSRRRIRVLPALGSSPETGFQYGLTVFGVFERPLAARTRPSAAVVYAIRTAKGQTRIGVEGERWTLGNARRVAGSLIWQEYPLPFYGIGDSTPASAKELFTPRGIEVNASLQQRVMRSLYALSSLRVVDQRVTADSNGLLATGTVVGSTGGRTVELSAGAQRDTRDNLFSTTRGELATLMYGRSSSALGADFDFGRLRLDARGYRPVGGGVVATQLLVTGIDGSAPFDAISLVGGGDIMRGYQRGRYRDRWLGAAQVEYRSSFAYRVGVVAFGGAGVIGESIGAAARGALLPTYGAGVRVLMDPVQRTAVRIDYGRGRTGNSGLYVGLNQAF